MTEEEENQTTGDCSLCHEKTNNKINNFWICKPCHRELKYIQKEKTLDSKHKAIESTTLVL